MRLSLKSLREAPPPRTLFHYTSAEGLCGIVESGSAWATVLHFMNDSLEFQHAIDVAKGVLEIRSNANASVEDKQIYSLISNGLDIVKSTAVCVFSLTARGDLLSQWRGYCPPSGGFSIGFASGELRSLLDKQGFWLAPCVYDLDAQRELLIPILDKGVSDIRSSLQDQRLTVIAISSFLLEFSTVAPIVKHPAFQEEEEWRVVSNPIHSVPALQVRAGRNLPIPYLPLDLRTNGKLTVIDQVIVGPHPHRELAKIGVSRLLPDAKVELSSVPYRTW